MPLTPNYNIFYPGSSDPWDMSANLNAMANSIDTALADVGGVKVSTTISGLGVGDFDGQFGWLSGIDAGLRWTGTAWQAGQGQTVADTAARAILFPTPVVGDKVYRIDVGATEIYSGTVWNIVPGSQATPTAIPIANGGTGATAASAARQNLGLNKSILQVVRSTPSATTRTTTSATFSDASESIIITPSASTSSILVLATFEVETLRATAGNGMSHFQLTTAADVALDGAESAVVNSSNDTAAYHYNYVTLFGYHSPATTSATTYKLRFKSATAGVSTSIYANQAKTVLYAFEIGA